jgi:hypothetical protein
MRLGFRSLLSTFLLVLTMFVPISSANANGCGTSAGGPFDGGDGSAGSPFLVSTASQLASIETNACLTNSYHFKQTADIDLSGVTWTPIGTSFDFDGSYDGDFHTISYLSMSGATRVGLFGTISGATIENLRFTDISLSGSGYAGVVAAFTKNSSTINKIAISGATVTSTGSNAGGVTGMTQTGRSFITNISVSADVSAAGNAGGLVGQVEFLSATVSDVWFSGSVTGTGQMVGGIVGYGIAQTIENAYSIGNLTGGTVYRGGILARDGNGAGVVTNSYFLGAGVTQLSSNYATSKTATELATLSTYASATWSITDDLDAVSAGTATEDWLIYPNVNSGFPVHIWQIQAGYLNPTAYSSSDFYVASSNQVVAATSTTDTYASIQGDYLDWVLTDDAETRAGAIWHKKRLDLTRDFEINAEIYLGDDNDGADGLAFVLQSSSSSSLSTGGGLGFSSIVPALAVEFDTYPNGAATDHTDTTNDYWGTYNNANVDGGSASTAQALDPDNVAGTDKQFSLGDIEDGAWRAVRFSWDADNETFTARVDNNSNGDFQDSGEELSYGGLSLTGASSTFGNSPVYWGFTASTGGSTNEQRVRFLKGSELLGTSFANIAPTIENEANRTLSLSGGNEQIDLTISDDLTTQAQWSVTAVSSDTNVATVSAAITSSTNARVTLTPVAEGSTTITVTITDADGASAIDTFVVSIASAPGSPTSVVALAGELSAALSWSAPTNTGGSAIIGFKVESSTNNGGTWSTEIASTGSSLTTATITNMVAGSSYLFRVSAINAVGSSPASLASNALLVVPPAPVPYSGPQITNLAQRELQQNTKTQVTIQGLRLDGVTGASVDGKAARVISKTSTTLIIELPELTAGLKDLQLTTSYGNLSHQDAFRVLATKAVSSAAAEQKLNAGSFKGFVAIYAKGYEGKRLSAKVGRDWVVVPSLASGFERVVEFTGAGVELGVKIYIDRVFVDTISLITK